MKLDHGKEIKKIGSPIQKYEKNGSKENP